MAKDELLKTNKIRILQKTKKTTCTVILYALLVFGVFIVCFPFLWMVLTSIKTSEEVLYLTFFPRTPQWHNYATVFDRVDILRALLNTLIVEITAKNRLRRGLQPRTAIRLLFALWLKSESDTLRCAPKHLL